MTTANRSSEKAQRERLARTCIVSVTLLAAQSATSFAQSSSSSAGPASGQRQASIIVLPQSTRACPGQSVDAKYVERMPDGSQVALAASEVRQVVRTVDTSATMRRDGSWQTNPQPMSSVLSGFRLSVSLARDSSIHGDTVVAPKYDCVHGNVRLSPSDRFQSTHAYVRLGTFATPFYDSVVVAVVEIESRVLAAMVLSPSEMKPGVITISAPGQNGVNGRDGRQGAPGSDCSNGDPGEDGDRGEPGLPGGQVDIITQQGSPWLADLVTVANPGGRGGKGGAGGLGGNAGVVGSGTGGRGGCRPRPGRSGRAGQPGPNGSAGPLPRVTSGVVPLLWSGSPIWSDAAARRSIEGLLALEAKR